jgi:hypothetical protein
MQKKVQLLVSKMHLLDNELKIWVHKTHCGASKNLKKTEQTLTTVGIIWNVKKMQLIVVGKPTVDETTKEVCFPTLSKRFFFFFTKILLKEIILNYMIKYIFFK